MKITPLRGIPIESGPSEDRFLEGWLNDDWDKLPAEWSLAIGTTLSEVSERQDNSARKAIIEKFLPTLRAADQNRAQIILPGGMTKAAVHTRMETALRIGRTFLPLQESSPVIRWCSGRWTPTFPPQHFWPADAIPSRVGRQCLIQHGKS